MAWENKLAFLGAIPLFLLLAFVCDVLVFRYPMFTPGQVASGLLPPQAFSTEHWGLGPIVLYVFLLDILWWLVLILVAYALIVRRKTLLRRMVVPFAAALALLCEGIAFQYSLFTPGVGAWRILHSESSAYHPSALGLAIVIDTASWCGIFMVAYKLVPQLHRKVE